MLKHLLRGGSGIKGNSWVALLGGSDKDDSDSGKSVAIGPDGSVYVCGYTDPAQAQGNDTYDGFIAKLDSSGTVQWQKTIVGEYQETSNSVAVGPDGSVHVCVYQYASGGALTDCLVVKFDSSGKLQFQKALGWSRHTYGQSVAIGPDGSVYVCGYTYSADSYSRYDCFIAKLDSSGALQWEKKLHDPNADSPDVRGNQGKSVAVGPDGSVYVCGSSATSSFWGSTNPNSNVLIAKFDSSGVLQWQKYLDGGESEGGVSVAVGPDGSVHVCGITNSYGSGNYDILIAKLNSSGSIQWQKTIGERYGDQSFSVAVGPDGSVYVCGEIKEDSTFTKYECLIVKFDPSGTLQWQKYFDYSDASSLAIGSDDSVYVCGTSASGLTGWYDLLLARITDADINQSNVVYGPFTLQDVSVHTRNSYLSSETASLSVSNIGLSVSTASLTIADANYISKKYEGE